MLFRSRGHVLVVAGQRQPVEVHLLAHAINTALDSIGNTVTLIPTAEISANGLKGLEASSADTLVILGGNPVYQFNWMPKVKTVVRLGYDDDETAAKSNWNFPATHFLESWGDVTAQDGSVFPVQPLTQPLFGGVTDLELLARIAGEAQTGAHEIVRATIGGSEESWKKFLFNGFAINETKSVSNVRLAQ